VSFLLNHDSCNTKMDRFMRRLSSARVDSPELEQCQIKVKCDTDWATALTEDPLFKRGTYKVLE
jgi:hypothetical protein